MLKTKEYLKSQFETGDIPTGEDYENLIDSFWHKSELGQVAEGDARPVTGGDVQAAIAAAITAEVLRPIVESLLSEMLPALLSEFVTGTTLSSALNGVATQTWVAEPDSRQGGHRHDEHSPGAESRPQRRVHQG